MVKTKLGDSHRVWPTGLRIPFQSCHAVKMEVTLMDVAPRYQEVADEKKFRKAFHLPQAV